MTITEVRVRPWHHERLRALVSVVFDDCFAVHGMKIIADDDGYFLLAMPSRRMRDGTFEDVAHPITAGFRKTVEDAVFDEYDRLLRAGRIRSSRES